MASVRSGFGMMLVVACLAGAPAAARATDGAVGINQALAAAGGITPGDAAGFPITIDRPGIYRLTGNLAVPDANTDGIVVGADEVTIDLNGFSINGATMCSGDPTTCTSTGSGRGIVAAPLIERTAVRDGTVRRVGNIGVFLGDHARVEGVRCRSNGTTGIVVGVDSLVRASTSSLNGALGISSAGESAVEGNTVFRNGKGGIFAGAGSTVSGNTVGRNDGVGFFVGAGSSVVGNTVRDNDDLGITMEAGVGYAHNVLTANNGGNAQPQAQGGIQTGPNVCGSGLCP